jgi:hypothetical protein
MNTGTPRLLKPSASRCRLMVLPVPVAPVIRPWRLASDGSNSQKTSPRWATRMGSGIVAPRVAAAWRTFEGV